ncbi:hypothetical protein ABLE91_05775 [Aquabacter sp. CN5-332]|uniref:hypothetical protein n=1 Tax=Aquabacter sp. CN5-332 TaxID=3156608 RepID=UPI0032B3D1E8
MIRVRMNVSTVKKGDLEKKLAELRTAFSGPKEVKVGLPVGKADANVIEYAFFNHFGTKGSGKGFVRNGIGGFGGPIPARPFIKAAMFEGQGEVKAAMQSVAKITINGGDLQAGMMKLGLLGQNLIQDKIKSGMAPANSPLTIKIKGSSGTLRDEGRLFGSITWKLDGVT